MMKCMRYLHDHKIQTVAKCNDEDRLIAQAACEEIHMLQGSLLKLTSLCTPAYETPKGAATDFLYARLEKRPKGEKFPTLSVLVNKAYLSRMHHM